MYVSQSYVLADKYSTQEVPVYIKRHLTFIGIQYHNCHGQIMRYTLRPWREQSLSELKTSVQNCTLHPHTDEIFCNYNELSNELSNIIPGSEQFEQIVVESIHCIEKYQIYGYGGLECQELVNILRKLLRRKYTTYHPLRNWPTKKNYFRYSYQIPYSSIIYPVKLLCTNYPWLKVIGERTQRAVTCYKSNKYNHINRLCYEIIFNNLLEMSYNTIHSIPQLLHCFKVVACHCMANIYNILKFDDNKVEIKFPSGASNVVFDDIQELTNELMLDWFEERHTIYNLLGQVHFNSNVHPSLLTLANAKLVILDAEFVQGFNISKLNTDSFRMIDGLLALSMTGNPLLTNSSQYNLYWRLCFEHSLHYGKLSQDIRETCRLIIKCRRFKKSPFTSVVNDCLNGKLYTDNIMNWFDTILNRDEFVNAPWDKIIDNYNQCATSVKVLKQNIDVDKFVDFLVETLVGDICKFHTLCTEQQSLQDESVNHDSVVKEIVNGKVYKFLQRYGKRKGVSLNVSTVVKVDLQTVCCIIYMQTKQINCEWTVSKLNLRELAVS